MTLALSHGAAGRRYRLSLTEKRRLVAQGILRARARMCSDDSGVGWARKYRGDPVGFIGELMGPAWYDDSWMAWRVFVMALLGVPITDQDELRVYEECTGLPIQKAPTREAWVPVGRRGGKSRVLAMVALYVALCTDYSPYLAPGEVGYVTVLADMREHAAAIMNYLKAALRHPRLQPVVSKQLVESIQLTCGVEIEVVTASIAAVRSRTVIAALCDEIAFWPVDETCANPDVEILNGLRPAMATIPNSLLLAASSRYARRGSLYTNWRDHFGQVEGPLVWSASTERMNPSIDRAFLASEYERDPVAAAAEYGTEWRSDVAAFIEHELVEAVTPRGITEIPPVERTQYSAFIDPSGGAQDSMTLAIAHLEGNVGILDRVVEVRPPFATRDVVGQFAAILQEYSVFSVQGDHYGGEWPRQQFAEVGIRYELSDKRKSDIYREFLPLLTSRRCQLLDVTRLRLQIEGLERRVARGGRDSVDHAPGAHDDLANVAAGVLVSVAGDERMAVIRRYLGVA